MSTYLSPIKRPWITEKAAALARKGTYIFLVELHATKNEVKKELKKLYGVDAVSIRVVRAQERRTRFHGITSAPVRYKKAIAKLKEGQSLDIIPQ